MRTVDDRLKTDVVRRDSLLATLWTTKAENTVDLDVFVVTEVSKFEFKTNFVTDLAVL